MDTSSFELRGLALPALRTAGGYFASRDKYDVAFSDLLIVIMTPVGSRPMSRSFGSFLYRSLFDPATLSTSEAINQIIRSAVNRWAPHVYIEKIEAKQVDRGLALGVWFGLVEERLTQQRLVLLTKSDLAKFVQGAA